MSEKPKKRMPKGGRKGGTTFPRIDLCQALDYAKTLVSKTHSAPQSAEIILPSVFGSSKDIGIIKASALKQFKLMEGNSKAYVASEDSRKISSAPREDVLNLIRKVCLNPHVFNKLYNTFSGVTTSKAKIKQQASDLKVHPDLLDECANLFINSLVHAGLATINDDQVTIGTMESDTSTLSEDSTSDAQTTDKDRGKNTAQEEEEARLRSLLSSGVKAKSNIEIKIDPSMDPEKLDKLLGVLKKYGQI
jgi:hypothetical protein